MSISKSIGKNTLGGGNSMQVNLKTYNRSTHNLSCAWRSSMGVGTLVPCLKLIGLPGDTFDIDIDTKVLTHPTVGPLFGSYKLQIDIFTAPFRLYNAMLHNNALNIGLDMSKVKLPKVQEDGIKLTIEDSTHLTYSSSSIVAYLGRRSGSTIYTGINITNAVPWLAYLDIFKNYYANKQEENYYWIGKFDTTYKVDDSNINYTIITGEQTIVSGYFLIKNANINIADYTIVQYSKNGYTKYYEPSYLKAHFTITQSGNDIKYTRKSDGTVVYGKLSGFATDTRKNSIANAKLSELDTLRENILKSGSTQFTVNSKTNGYFQNTLGKTNEILNLKNAGCGLLLKTYQSDIFNNWIKTEWISGENGISAITAISTVGDKFTIDQLNLSKKVYDMLNRIAVSGGTYQDWVETVYTSEWNMHTETPMYEGGLSSEIEFQEVVSNSATADEPLGTLAGRGINTQKKGGKLHIKVTEPCYIMGIASITPRVDYCQGNDFDVYFETLNDLHKPALDGIGYQDLLTYKAAGWASAKTAYGKTVAWIDYMTNFNKTYGTFAENGNEAFMVLNRIFEPKNGDFTQDLIDNTSYIDPSKYNYIFAETSAESQNFWVQIGFGIEARRVMSAKQIPNL